MFNICSGIETKYTIQVQIFISENALLFSPLSLRLTLHELGQGLYLNSRLNDTLKEMDLSWRWVVYLTKLSELLKLKHNTANIIFNETFLMFKKVMSWPISRN